MRVHPSVSLRLAATTLACAAALTAGVSHAENYFAVLPLLGADASQATRPVRMVLAAATPPAATVGVPYSFNLGALLSLDGPEGTSPSNVRWSVVSGELPPGLELVGNEVVGTPTGMAPGGQVVIQAEHVSGYSTDSVTMGYSFFVSAPIVDFGGYRAWADGTYAQSCEGYIRSGRESYPYQGAVGDGVYRISPAGVAIDVYCDQTTDSGGWALLMKQAANDGGTLQGDTEYWTQGTVLNDTAQGRSLADGNFVSAAFAQLPVAGFRLQASNESEMRYQENSQIATGLIAFGQAEVTIYSDDGGVFVPDRPNWFIHANNYPTGQAIKSARFGFNFIEQVSSTLNFDCGARWGWAANQDPIGYAPTGTFDACGGLGAWGVIYGGVYMDHDKSSWQPATLYLWGR